MNLQVPVMLDLPHTECRQCSIRKLSLFQDISGKRSDEVQVFRSSQLLIPVRTNIFKEGDKHDFVYTLFSGWGVIYKTVSNNGKRQILRFLLPGDLIGYQTNAKGAVVHSASAITESVLCAFPREKLNEMLKANSELAIRLVNMESRDMSICQNHLMAAGRKSAKESVAFVLLELYYRVQLQLKDSYDAATNTIEFPITQGDLGDAVGLTNIHVNRVIKDLTKDKLIYCNKKRLTILNVEKLCSIAEFSPDMISSHP